MKSENDEILKLKKEVDLIINYDFNSNKIKSFIERSTFIKKDKANSQSSKTSKSSNNLLLKLESLSAGWKNVVSIVEENSANFKEIHTVINQKLDQNIHDHLEELLSNKSQLEEECKALNMFKNEFQLVEEDYYLLTSDKQSYLEEYLRISRRINHIQDFCKNLDDHSYNSLGSKLLFQMDDLLDKCYAKISETMNKVFVDSPNPLLVIKEASHKEALEIIKENPVYLQKSLLGYISNRRSYISNKFYQHITVTFVPNKLNPSSLKDPSYSIDPIMIFILKLAKEESLKTTEFLKEIGCPDFETLSKELTSSSFEILSRQLKEHFEKVYLSQPPVMSIFLIIMLLEYYIPAIKDFVLPSSGIVRTLAETSGTSRQMINSYTHLYCRQISSNIKSISSSLEPPSLFYEATSLLHNIASLGSKSSFCTKEISDLKLKMIDKVIDALIQSCHISASGLSRPTMAIYLINCFSQLQSIFNLINPNNFKRESIENQISTHIETLVAEQLLYIFKTLKLDLIYMASQSVLSDSKVDFLENCDMSVDQVHYILSDFFIQVKNKDIITLPELKYLKEDSIRETINTRCLTLIEAATKEITTVIKDIPQLANIQNSS